MISIETSKTIREIFNAQSVALVGASANPLKWGFKTLKCIVDGGYQGEIYAVNPNEKEILGVPVYPSIRDIPSSVDLLVVAVPAARVADVLKQGAEKNVKGAVILTSGFREAGRPELEKELAEIVIETGIRLIGPNVQGITYIANKLCAVPQPLITKPGPVGIIAQSGSVSATLAEWFEHEDIGITGFVNLGNQVDLCESDFLEYFSTDEDTKVIMLYVEGPKNGPIFKETLKRAAARKPVVILKPGRSASGKKVAATHTASIAGNDTVFGYACRQYGAFRASTMEDFYDVGKALALQPLAKGNRVLVFTSSGGAGSMVLDSFDEHGLVAAAIPQEMVDELKNNVTGTGANYSNNPVDMPFLDKIYWQQAMEVIAKYQIADSVIFSVADAVPGIEDVIKNFSSKVNLPIVVSYMGGGEAELTGRISLHKAGIPVYPIPERAVAALAGLTWYSEFRRNLLCRQ